jgi:outer membrane protein OmpA-like peptidoglycan-associated protein
MTQFEFHSGKLERSGKLQLDNLARAMNDERIKNHKFLVEVQTEPNGKAAFNEELSKSRADSVIAHLIGRGIAAERLQLGSKGFGYSPDSANSKAKSSSLVRTTSSAE